MGYQLALTNDWEERSRPPRRRKGSSSAALPSVDGGRKVFVRENLHGQAARRHPLGLTGTTAAFGRHESFPIRFGWITKGLQALEEDSRVFTRDDATVILGVGKNMVASIRYWLQAARVAHRDPRTNTLKPTAIAEIVFGDSGDPYLEDEGTIWLLHWLIATNPVDATAVYWFFNHFHKPTFTTAEVASALTDYAKRELASRTSAATLKSDAQLVLRMYSRTTGNTRITLEDTLDSPLAMLDLQERLDTRSWRAVRMERRGLPLDVFAFAIAELFERRSVSQLAITDLMYSANEHCAPGAVFRITEDSLVGKLEALCGKYPRSLRLDRTAGIFQLYRIAPLDSVDVLRTLYGAGGRSAS